jgi:hypothetical protein
MYAVPGNSGEGELLRLRQRPKFSNWMVREHWYFIPENRVWDADERELISKGTGVHCLSSEYGLHEPDTWWKILAQEYLSCRNVYEAVCMADLSSQD